jgi:8-oxo-dGTP diphosphatase
MQIRCRGIILDKEGKILVVRHGADFDYYALPGGKLDDGENPLNCIKREIFEEFGIEIQLETTKLLYVHDWKNKEGVHNLEFIFLIKDNQEFVDLENKKGTHAFEIFEIKWIDKDAEINLLPKQILIDYKKGFSNEVIFLSA